MPTYTYTKGRKSFTEHMSIAEMEELAKDPKVKFELAAPRIAGPDTLSTYKKGDKFRQTTIEPILDKFNPKRTEKW